ncbi:hypothetical protein BH10PLA2_BH10PLA2_31400 [soil metagenome]
MEAAEKRVGRIADLQAIKRRLKSWLVKDQAM